MKLLRYLFGLQDEVTRKGYLIAGFSLAALKFAIDFALVYFTTGKYWTLLAYLSPIMILRNEALDPAPEYLLWVMALYTLPFAWSAVIANRSKSTFVMPRYIPTSLFCRSRRRDPACTSAAYPHSSSRRCCGSIAADSAAEIPKQLLSNRSAPRTKPPCLSVVA